MAVISVAEYKAYAGISGTTFDAVLAVLIACGQELAEDWLGFAFDTGTRTERYSGPIDSNKIYLKGYPVTSITSVKRYSSVSAYELVDSTTYTYDAAKSILYLPGTGRGMGVMARDEWGPLEDQDLGVGPRWVEGTSNYEIVYVSGWASNAMPNRAKYAMYKLIDAMMADRRVDPTMKSQSVRDASYTKFDASPTVQSMIHHIFASFKLGGP